MTIGFFHTPGIFGKMSFKKFKKLFINITDLTEPNDLLRIINQLQGNIENSITSMVTLTQNDSAIVSNVALVAGRVNVVNHTLGRKLIKWTPARVRGQCRIWDSQDDNPSPELTLWLHTDTNVTVDLEVA